jgi:tetrahedral aminopeptidase
MLSAHMDEIGLIATHIDENGFVRFTTIGGVRPHTCIGGRVRFLNGTRGLIYMDRPKTPDRLPGHRKPVHRRGRYQPRARLPGEGGRPGAFERPFLDLGDRLVSKAMDDRISGGGDDRGPAPAAGPVRQPARAVFRLQHPGRSWAARRDHGRLRRRPRPGRGGRCDPTGDMPKARQDGSGPGQRPGDQGARRRHAGQTRAWCAGWWQTAEQAACIPYQLEVLEGGTTDARAIQADARRACRSGCLVDPHPLHPQPVRDGGRGRRAEFGAPAGCPAW